MAVQVWDVETFLAKAQEHSDSYNTPDDLDEVNDGPSWLDSTRTLARRAIARGDGVAVYVNQDLGHPEIGQWRVISFGGPDAGLETRDRLWGTGVNVFTYGWDNLPVTLPDTPTLINWRYQLEAIVPSWEQQEKANVIVAFEQPADLWKHLEEQHHHDVTGLTDADLPHWQQRHQEKLHGPRAHVPVAHTHERGIGEAFNDPRVPCCGRDAADCDCQTTITLPTPELLELRRVWQTGDDTLLNRHIVGLVRDVFDGLEGDLQRLADIRPDRAAPSHVSVPVELLRRVLTYLPDSTSAGELNDLLEAAGFEVIQYSSGE